MRGTIRVERLEFVPPVVSFAIARVFPFDSDYLFSLVERRSFFAKARLLLLTRDVNRDVHTRLTQVRRCIFVAFFVSLLFLSLSREGGRGFIAERLACRVIDRLTILFPLLRS